MLDLVFSILFSSLIFVIFKLFDSYKIETFYAIIVNYLVACSVGLSLSEKSINITEIPEKPWFLGALAMGALFIGVFNLMAMASQRIGVSAASVATKMSLALAVLFSVFKYKESLGLLRGTGILMALAAVYFTTLKKGNASVRQKGLFLVAGVFLGSGLIDIGLKYMEDTYVPPKELSLFSSSIFGAAASIGIIIIIVRTISGNFSINIRNCIAGIVLGIPNYFSIYYLLKALKNDNFDSSAIFTINNVAIVLFSTLLGLVFFKEKLGPKNWLGIAMAMLSIILVALFK